MLTLQAPAKLNLTLEVLAKRQDGFHEIRSVIQTINLCDSLRFELSRSIKFNAKESSWNPEKSLVPKAASLLQKVTGCGKGATIEVNKRIPLLSGLGGDSSDAAAVLRGLNKLWELGLPQEKLLELASQFGSDIAFFLYGGTALVEGRGEKVIPLPPLYPMWVVLLLPPVLRTPDKTGRLYASLKASHYTGGQMTDRLVAQLGRGGEVLPDMLFNVFDGVARDSFTGLNDYWEQFSKAGAESVHLAGSGPTLFTLVKDKAQAGEIYQRLRQQGLESYLVEALAIVEKVE